MVAADEIPNQNNNLTVIADKQPEERHVSVKNLSQKVLAETVVRENRICHVSKMGAFMVQGSKGIKYAVTLFPKETCLCPSTGECYHILAAKLSVGMPSSTQPKTINLSQLKRNSRKRSDKRGGRKKPRTNDISTILPAPDSTMLNDTLGDMSEIDSIKRDSGLPIPNHASTPKKPGILSKGQRVTEKLRVKFQDSIVSESVTVVNDDNEVNNTTDNNNADVDSNLPVNDLELQCSTGQSDSKQSCEDIVDNTNSKSNSQTSLESVPKPISKLSLSRKRKSRADKADDSVQDLGTGVTFKSDSKIQCSKELSNESKPVDKSKDCSKELNDESKSVDKGAGISKVNSSLSFENRPKKFARLSRSLSCKRKSLDGESKSGTHGSCPKMSKVIIINENVDRDTGTIKKVRHWLPNLSLTFQDKFLIQNGNWLNDNHMRAANDIAKGQFKDINGFQDTVMVPYLDKNGTWVIPELRMIRQEPPCVQIHHTGNSHWVVSFQFKNDKRIYLLDSLYSQQRIPTSLRLQLALLYGQGNENLQVLTPVISKQKGGSDCGIYAIANMVEFCIGNFLPIDDKFNIKGDYLQYEMRENLLTYFQNGIFCEFEKTGKNRKEVKMIEHEIAITCPCGLPDEYCDMIGCDDCDGWYHKICANMDVSKLPESWQCDQCLENDNKGLYPKNVSPRWIWYRLRRDNWNWHVLCINWCQVLFFGFFFFFFFFFFGGGGG